uniref:Uncharacterized protein n=1 Tax=Serinus canaria TaxID=9135 RepID=A0A8C9NAU3_SERCA
HVNGFPHMRFPGNDLKGGDGGIYISFSIVLYVFPALAILPQTCQTKQLLLLPFTECDIQAWWKLNHTMITNETSLLTKSLECQSSKN